MKSKNLFYIFIFGLFLFLLPSFAEAMCPICCGFYQSNNSDCKWGHFAIGSERLGIIGSIEEASLITDFFCYDCSDASGKCDSEKFSSGNNGQSCTARDRCWNFVCSDCIKTGVWDASDPDSGDRPACVFCNGKIEQWVRGDTSAIYAGCAGAISSCSYEGNTGDGDCESACGADPECDERDYGLNVPASGGECDNCVFVPDQPDLIITDIWTDGNTIRYTIRNQGNSTAGLSRSYLYVDGSYETYDSVSSLSANTSSNESFSYDWIANCTGTSDTIRVCADGAGAVSESNEGNNCRQEVFDCPLPDFRITDIWFEPPDKRVHYTIQNQGDVLAAGSNSYLYVNGSYETLDSVSTISAGASRDEYFSGWDDCIGNQSYSIEVCADKAGPSGAAASGGGDVDELDENNNCRTENLTCPAECTGDINASPETATAPCDFTIDIYNVDYCQGLTWEVTRDGSYVDSGTVTGDTNWTETIYDNGIGVDSSIYYRLYIDGDQKDYDAVACQEEPPLTCAEVGGICKTNPCSTYEDCSPAAEDYDCSGSTPYCCLGSCTTPPPEFDFSIAVSPDSGSVTQGGFTSPSTVTVTLISGTSQTVSFYIGSGLPSDASASFSPSSCNPTCSSSMTIFTSATTPTGIYQLTVVGTTGTITHYDYYDLTVTEAGPGISPPQVRTVPISEQGTVTTNSATILGELTNVGGAASCLVWFKYKKSTDIVWTEVCETTITSIGSFSCDLTDLTSNTTYDFEAFAKNGGSW